jgi:RNA polymerase sigma-70 factor (ECF subfamily)
MDQQTEKCLIDKCQKGDTDAFRKLVEAHQGFVYAATFRLLCNDFDAEEATQETFIKVWKNMTRFNNEMRFTTWLYKIAVNLCYDKIKVNNRLRNRVQFDYDHSVILNYASIENIENSVINRELAEIIRFLTGELTPKQKLVFTLTELECLTVDEINAITGLSPEKIKSNLYCAKQTIKVKLSQIEERRGKYHA